ncbi:hypothetical protein CYMTET_34451 [Cymbomonas tetramitiformis]|uniref:Uncharacterized protein n=1 Tax=Cymbomonas tetramitiformis TaxID=36881 RepID=A0AAE0KQ72_9CHLO|nr:hypothetical protein CYMTET_34451 [Cymbomonas tetramitiformis]
MDWSKTEDGTKHEDAKLRKSQDLDQPVMLRARTFARDELSAALKAVKNEVVTEVKSAKDKDGVPYWKQGDISMYNKENMRKRLDLKDDPEVRAAVDRWWVFLTDSGARTSVEKREYMKMSGAIYVTLVGEDVSSLILEENWHEDSKGQPSLQGERFFEAIFELADVWCTSVEAQEYVEFLNRCLWDTIQVFNALQMAADGGGPDKGKGRQSAVGGKRASVKKGKKGKKVDEEAEQIAKDLKALGLGGGKAAPSTSMDQPAGGAEDDEDLVRDFMVKDPVAGGSSENLDMLSHSDEENIAEELALADATDEEAAMAAGSKASASKPKTGIINPHSREEAMEGGRLVMVEYWKSEKMILDTRGAVANKDGWEGAAMEGADLAVGMDMALMVVVEAGMGWAATEVWAIWEVGHLELALVEGGHVKRAAWVVTISIREIWEGEVSEEAVDTLVQVWVMESMAAMVMGIQEGMGLVERMPVEGRGSQAMATAAAATTRAVGILRLEVGTWALGQLAVLEKAAVTTEVTGKTGDIMEVLTAKGWDPMARGA